jgi:hypothetical protein
VTPAEILEPQPAPDRTERSRSVTDWFIEGGGLPPEVVELLLARREQGRAKYGTELESHNGRNALADAAQEAVDLLVYLAQELMEREDRGDEDPRLGQLFAQHAFTLGAIVGFLGVREPR